MQVCGSNTCVTCVARIFERSAIDDRAIEDDPRIEDQRAIAGGAQLDAARAQAELDVIAEVRNGADIETIDEDLKQMPRFDFEPQKTGFRQRRRRRDLLRRHRRHAVAVRGVGEVAIRRQQVVDRRRPRPGAIDWVLGLGDAPMTASASVPTTASASVPTTACAAPKPAASRWTEEARPGLLGLALVAVTLFLRPLLGPAFGSRLVGSRLCLSGSLAASRRDALLRIRSDRQGDQDRNEAGISHSSTRVVRLASLNDTSILHQIRGARVHLHEGCK